MENYLFEKKSCEWYQWNWAFSYDYKICTYDKKSDFGDGGNFLKWSTSLNNVSGMAFWWILIDISFRIFSFSGNKHRHLKDSLDVFKGMKLNWLMVCVNPDKIIYQPFDELKGISPLIVHKNHHTFWFIVLTVTFKNVQGRDSRSMMIIYLMPNEQFNVMHHLFRS